MTVSLNPEAAGLSSLSSFLPFFPSFDELGSGALFGRGFGSGNGTESEEACRRAPAWLAGLKRMRVEGKRACRREVYLREAVG